MRPSPPPPQCTRVSASSVRRCRWASTASSTRVRSWQYAAALRSRRRPRGHWPPRRRLLHHVASATLAALARARALQCALRIDPPPALVPSAPSFCPLSFCMLPHGAAFPRAPAPFSIARYPTPGTLPRPPRSTPQHAAASLHASLPRAPNARGCCSATCACNHERSFTACCVAFSPEGWQWVVWCRGRSVSGVFARGGWGSD